MKKLITPLLFMMTQAYALAPFETLPSSATPIAIKPYGQAYLTYRVKNHTAIPLSHILIDPSHQISPYLKTSVINNQCHEAVLKRGQSCDFTIFIEADSRTVKTTLTPKVCVINDATCWVPDLKQQVRVIVSQQLADTSFPIPYAGTYYPIYNAGAGQWIPPDQAPFNEVSALFVAFAHAYPEGNGAIFTFEAEQPEEPTRLTLLTKTARNKNPGIKILISLGWGKNDWTYIDNDYTHHANIFVPSVIDFIRSNQLDGIDIDDESIGQGGSGVISQAHFDGVIANLRNALNYASLQDSKPYYLTISPAGNNQGGGFNATQVDAQNAASFNLINIQSYYNAPSFSQDFYNTLISIGYPSEQIANGIDSEGCAPTYPPYLGFAGLFNWNMSADSACKEFENTIKIANLVHYPS